MMRTTVGLGLVLAGCGSRVQLGEAGESSGVVVTTDLTGVVGDDSQGDDDSVADDEGHGFDDLAGQPPPTEACDEEHPCLLDILVVVDNSGEMAPAQAALVRALVPLVRRLETHVAGEEDPVDVQMMFTTTDMGDPACAPFNPAGYVPSMGAPTATGCNLRIDDFTGLGNSPEVRPEVCTQTCFADVVPTDPFVAFYGDVSNNVGDGPSVDIDGDGAVDSVVAQAVACLAPQGINGCGYESPLGAMMQALDPAAAWNAGERPFLREGSRLVIVLLTTEIDCSTEDPSVLDDPALWENNPNGGFPQRSSAACWNAAMSCGETDGAGNYVDCALRDAPLVPASRYAEFLVDQLTVLEGREVAMVAITGVPEVTARSEAPPFEPTDGGLAKLAIHDFREGLPPAGDMLPGEAEDGVTPQELQWMYGIGAGCVRVDGEDGARGLPNPRIHEVCGSLDGEGEVRCCVESICDPIARLDCIDGWVAR